MPATLPTKPPPKYLATMAPGLETVAEAEIYTKLDSAWIANRLRGRVLFSTTAPWPQIRQLKCVDNLYYHLGWLQVGPHRTDLHELEEAIGEIPLVELPAPRAAGSGAHIIVNASRTGKHTYSRFQAAAAATRGLCKAHGFIPGTATDHELNFRLDILDHKALFSLKLTDSTFRFRGQRAFSPAALRPPLAHALIWLSVPVAEDIFLDPFCGSGTIPIERAAYKALSITGGDIRGEAVAAARQNAPPAVEIIQLDACRLENIVSGSLTTIVSNLPWGKQVSPEEDLCNLYTAFFLQMQRALRPDGRAILLTDQQGLVEAAAATADLQVQALHTVSLHGALPVVYRVQRT